MPILPPDLKDRLRRAAFGLGPLATAKAVGRRLRRAEPWRPGTVPSTPSPFDLDYGTDTGGFLAWRDLRSGQRSDAYISGYFGTAPSVGRRLLALVPRPADYTFVDVGCGKGRMVVLASERPFARILGIEIAAPLVETARRNAALVASRFPGRPALEIVHADATRIDWPPGPLVLFLYQPFERPVLRTLLATLARSLAAAPRPVVLIYLNAQYAAVIDRTPILHRRLTATIRPTPEETPWSYAARGDPDPVVVWSTRSPTPDLAALAPG